MTTNIATTPQPPPTVGTGPRIVDLVAGELEGNAYDVDKLIAADLRARAEEGARPPPLGYGMYLRAGNGRDALADWYQEALDALMYGRQFVSGDQGAVIAYRYSIDLVRSLRAMIKERDGR